ncbi:MAG: hypothetical protein HY961_20035, partial [Ignavibacteriae bacterium]|nr:hypothetical protein [Ignavibacteriota bacterium]
MRSVPSPFIDNPRLPRWIFASLLVLTSLVVVVNSLESSVAKIPILILHASFLATIMLVQSVRVENSWRHTTPTLLLALAFALVLVASA